MFKILVCAVAVLLAAGGIYAADSKTQKDSEYRGLKIRNADADKDRPKVEDPQNNIIVENNAAANLLENTPPDCFAARIADKGKIFEWKAKWYFEGSGGPRLPDSKFSPDGSVLVIAEVAGAVSGPFASRLVLINTYNYKCIRIIEIPETRISSFILLPDTDVAVCVQEAQPSFKQEIKAFSLNLKTGSRNSETPSFSSKITGLAATPDNKLMIKTAESTKIYIFDLLNLAKDPVILETHFKGGLLAVADDGSYLAAAGKGRVLFFNLTTGQNTPFNEKELPQDFTPDHLVLCNENGSLFAASGEGRDIIWAGTGKVRTLAKNAGNILVYDKKNKRLMAETALKSTLVFYDVPKFEPTGICLPKKILPLTRGDITNLMAIPAGILVFDSHGNLFLLHKSKTNWKKVLILEAMK
jgi:WD40 repeat protein